MRQIVRIFADIKKLEGFAPIVSGANQLEYLCRSVKSASSVSYKK